MTKIVLQYSTGDARADSILQEITARFEGGFPARIAGYYVEGSYADQTAVTTSDLDLTIVFQTHFLTADEQERAQRLVAACKKVSTLELDITLVEEAHLRQGADPMFKLGARLCYGREIRDAVPLIPITEWHRQRMHAAYWLMINVFRRPQPVHPPLAFPQPEGAFFGYAARTVRLIDGQEIPTTRNLIRVTGWIATARIAFETQQYAVRKRDCLHIYQQEIGDEWTALLTQINERCRTAWQYRIPPTVAEQEELHALLEQVLAFENDFLVRYRRFLLLELNAKDPFAMHDALSMLERTFLADLDVIEAVRRLAHFGDPDVRLVAQQFESHWTS